MLPLDHLGADWLSAAPCEAVAKAYRLGTHRCVDPRQTLDRVEPHFAKIGITRIANITGLDRIGIPVALACRPNSRSLSVSQGKGSTLDAAKASAAMESVELYHAENIRLPLRLSSYEELQRTERVVDVAELPHAKDGLFDKHRRLLWIEGYDLLQHEKLWLPYEMVSTDFTLPFPDGYGCFPPNSNGLASGNTLLEAVSHGLCEVVERDAVTLWSLNSMEERSRTELDLDTVTDDLCRELVGRFARAKIAVRVWDVTSDMDLPCFRCLIAESSQDPLHFGYSGRGFGCHPSRSVALARALTEAAQARLTYIAGSRDDVSRSGYDRMRTSSVTAPSSDIPRPEKRDYSSISDWDEPTLVGDLNRELNSLTACGINRVIVVDLTREEFQIPVAKVVIPGLEGVIFEADYSPGMRAARRTKPQ
jgi:ribosomal protein S12 methylthiotransferase accessory factor